VTQFPVEISNEDAFASFKNVRHVTIKKVIEAVVMTEKKESKEVEPKHQFYCRATKV
jgi:hypothetical protein